MAGISTISKELKARCPHCHRSLDLSDVGHELFRRVLERLKKGETVVIDNFGRFKVKYRAPRKASNLTTGVTVLPEYWQILFRAAGAAKKAVNEARKAATKKGDQE
jgi:nucleoid DNA-binding protein